MGSAMLIRLSKTRFVLSAFIGIVFPLVFLCSWKEAFADKILDIQIYKGDLKNPAFQIRAPLVVLYVAKNFLPENIRKDLEESQIQIDEVVRNIEEKNLTGQIMDVVDNDKGRRIVITIEEQANPEDGGCKK